MIDYFNKTRSKLLKGIFICTLIFTVTLIILLVLVVLFIPDLEEIESWTQVALYILITSSALSLFIMTLAFLASYWEFALKEKVWMKQPFNQLTSVGFQKIKILDTTNWVLLEEVLVAKINQYLIVADVPGKNQITFNFLYKNPHSSDYKGIETGVRDSIKYYSSSGLTVSIQPDTFWTPSVNEINSMIESITLQLQSARQIPATIQAYEKEVKQRLIQKAFMGLG